MKILAHRGNTAGKHQPNENTLRGASLSLEMGFGLETDLRRQPGDTFYISHDPAHPCADNDAVRHARLWRTHPDRTIALNLKEPGHEEDLIRFLTDHQLLAQVFVFDMELIEERPGETARRLRSLSSRVRIAARVSDRNEPLGRALTMEPCDIVWLDEFERPWATREDLLRMQGAGLEVFAVSPELHGFPPEAARRRWDEFAEWGVDGLCTDHPMEAAERLGMEPDGYGLHLLRVPA